MPSYLDFLNYLALFLLFFVYISFFYGLIMLCDIPYKIAQKRNHPQQDAIQVAGWVSLFTLQIIWPFLWIWATLYQADGGWGLKKSKNLDGQKAQLLENKLSQLQNRFDQLEKNLSKTIVVKSDKPVVMNTIAKNLEGDI